jgi:putative SOS response-associated peptidase YedK
MCGRFDRHTELDRFSSLIEGLETSSALAHPPSYNIAPSQRAVVACVDDGCRTLEAMQWGLVPHWSSNSKLSKPINARAESIRTKPMFRDAFKNRRCLVLADGYYEWSVLEDGSKQPYYIAMPSAQPFLLAGIWAENTRLGPSTIRSFCIITTGANREVANVHDRMPVIIRPESSEQWLREVEGDTREALLRPYDGPMSVHPVSTYVNRPANDSPRCIEVAA